MIDKQKLLQWVEAMNYVYSAPPEEGDTPEEIAMWKGKVQMLNRLDMDIRAGNLDAEEVAHERS